MSATKTVSFYEDDTQAWGLIEADALMLLAKLPDACVDAIVTDPPYGIGFHDEAWDGKDIRRVAEGDGGSLAACEALERWTEVWAREARRVLKPGGYMVAFGAPRTFHRLVAGVEDAGLEIRDQLLWLNGQGIPKARRLPDGQSTTLKPAFEPILLARAPICGTVKANLERFGTGTLNVDAARIVSRETPAGFWPANVTVSHAPACLESACRTDCPVSLVDDGQTSRPPSRFFYCAKASRAEREEGCDQFPMKSVQLYTGNRRAPRRVRNEHPTVKPIELMRWLVRLTCPVGGVVLDPFTGSGSTGAAAVMEERLFLGIERESEYVDIACARLTHWAHNTTGSS